MTTEAIPREAQRRTLWSRLSSDDGLGSVLMESLGLLAAAIALAIALAGANFGGVVTELQNATVGIFTDGADDLELVTGTDEAPQGG